MTLTSSDATSSSVRSEVHHSIRLMAQSDLDVVVEWHREAFPAGFYAQLGSSFMHRWFAAHLDSPASVSLVACEPEGTVVGYLLGTTDDAAYRDRAAAKGIRLLARGVSALAARPGLWWEFARLRARPYAGRAARRLVGGGPKGWHGAGDGELVYICVEPEHRCLGAGAALLEAFTGEAVRSGTARLHLVTELDNLGAQRFYVRYGWQVRSDTAHALDGRTLVRIQRAIRDDVTCVV